MKNTLLSISPWMIGDSEMGLMGMSREDVKLAMKYMYLHDTVAPDVSEEQFARDVVEAYEWWDEEEGPFGEADIYNYYDMQDMLDRCNRTGATTEDMQKWDALCDRAMELYQGPDNA